MAEPMRPEDVPDELTRAAMEGYYGHAVPDGGFAVLRGQWQRAVAALLPAHEATVQAEAAANLHAIAANYADTLTGPRASFRRGIEAAARHIAPKPTPQEIAAAIGMGQAIACESPEDRIARGEA